LPPINWLHYLLPEALPEDKPVRATIRAFEQFPKGVRLTLQLEVQNLQTDVEVAVRLNDQPMAGWQRDGNSRLTAPVTPEMLRQGSNPVDTQLVKGSAKSADPRTVVALELHAVRE